MKLKARLMRDGFARNASTHATRRAGQFLVVAAMAIAGTLMIAMSSSAVGTFAPTITFETSTTQAAAHPDARVTIDNSASDENLKSIQLDLPDGFWGSLAAVSTKCPYATAQAGGCSSTSKIGTVVAEATVDNSNARLRGSVYLTTAAPSNDDPAGISIKFDAQVGGVDLDDVINPGRAQLRYAVLPTAPTGATGLPKGLRATVDNIPTSAQGDGRTVGFVLKKIVIDLPSNQSGGLKPLITNPSACGATTVGATITSYDGSVASVSDSYEVTGCSNVKFGPSDFQFNLATPAAGAATTLDGEISFPENSGTISSVTMTMPPGLSFNAPAYGASGDMCPASSINGGNNTPSSYFRYGLCPAQARVGTVEIETPLIDQTLVGDVYFIGTSGTPSVGISVNPGIAGNPKGVDIWMVGRTTGSGPLSPICGVGCGKTALQVKFLGLPDAPVSKIKIGLNLPPGTRANGFPSEAFSVATAADPNCVPNSEFSGTFVSHAASKSAGRVATEQLTGCDLPALIDSGPTSPAGKTISDNTPTFGFSPSPQSCAIDEQVISPSCSSPTTLSTQPDGVHFFDVGNQSDFRVFAIDTSSPGDVTPPDTSLTSPPLSTPDTTPTFNFTATESSTFQCSLSGGAFLPCDPGAPAGTSGTYTVSDDEALFPTNPDYDPSYDIRVRAMDAAGNIDPTPASANFTVDIPFNPTFDVSLSTRQARAHPDLDVTIENLSHEDLDDLTLKMPDGFMGGLQGVAAICSIADASAGNCTDASKVGTVDTEAIVDESVVRISGTVYLTDPVVAGDPAGLSVKVPAVIQDINLGNVVVPIRLQVRGNVQGIDSVAIDLPKSIVPNNGFDGPTFFDMRKMTLKLRNNPAAAQPLLTNASTCALSEFAVTFTGSNGTTASRSVPYQTTGCSAIGFTPQFKTTFTNLNGGLLKLNDHVKMTATLTANPGDAAIKKADITLPPPINIDPTQVGLVCEELQKPNCPASSLLGFATATSPLLPPGETLSGPAYMLRAKAPAVIPRVYVKLQGRISAEVIGIQNFVGTPVQINSIFQDLPDVPLSSFTLTTNKLLQSSGEACDRPSQEVVGTFTGYNGSSSNVFEDVPFDCSGVYVRAGRFKSGRKPSLKFDVQIKGTQPKLKSFRVDLPRSLPMNVKNVARKLSIKANGRRLKPKCFRAVNPRVLLVNLCGKKASTLNFFFKPGSLIAAKKVKKLKVKVTSTDVKRHKDTRTIKFDGKTFVKLSTFWLPLRPSE